MKLKPGLGASYAIRPGNGVGLFYSSRTHTVSVSVINSLKEPLEKLEASLYLADCDVFGEL